MDGLRSRCSTSAVCRALRPRIVYDQSALHFRMGRITDLVDEILAVIVGQFLGADHSVPVDTISWAFDKIRRLLEMISGLHSAHKSVSMSSCTK